MKQQSPSDRVYDILSSMSLEDKIGQMSQIDLSLLVEKDPDTNKATVSEEKLEHYFGVLGIGSLLNTVGDERWEAQQYREVLLKIQDITQRHGRPPVIWGLDSVHGANYINRAVLTPQQLNLAASFNTTVAYQAGKLASRDTRAAGINWLFSPILGLALEPRWSRVYETFGEDPKLVSSMGAALISGIQVPDDDSGSVPSRAAASAKHFVGYSKPQDGHDRSPSWIPTRHLYEYFVPPWRAAMGANVKTVMESYNDYDGVPNVANRNSLKYLLRQQLGFNGVLVTDYQEILNLHSWHHVAASDEEATVYALKEGTVDMSMIPFDPDGFRIAIQKGIGDGRLSMERLSRSVERVLALKEDLGMLDKSLVRGDINLQKIGNRVDKADALDMAHQGIVLTENNGLLPLNASAPIKIHITGPTANSLRYQSGGWTFQWQGVDSDEGWFDYGTTVLDAANSFSGNWQVTYSCGVDILGEACSDPTQGKVSSSVIDQVADLFGFGLDHPVPSIKETMGFASQSDYVVVCVGEENYTEKPGDIRSLKLPEGQIELVRALSKEDAKIILVYFGGRPRILDEMVELADAVLIGFLPGPDAGAALMNIISGRVNPSGRLPLTYPKFEDGGGAPYFHAVTDQCTGGTGTLPHWEYVPCEVQWPFGHGLSYTSFRYSLLSINTYQLKYRAPGQARRYLKDSPDTLFISVKVKNTGMMSGSETVLFFTFDEGRHTTPEYKRLRAFEKVHLAPGEEQVVTASLSLSDPDFMSIGPHDDTHLVVQDGMGFWVGVGADVDCREAKDSAMCSDFVSVDAGGDEYTSACDAACTAWEQSQCSSMYGLSAPSCWQMCTANSSRTDVADGWGWNYVKCIESVVFDISQTTDDLGDQCWKMTGLCRDIFSGPTAVSVGPNAPPTLAIGMALASGLITTFFIIFAMRGGLSRFDSQARARGEHGDVQFSVVDGGID